MTDVHMGSERSQRQLMTHLSPYNSNKKALNLDFDEENEVTVGTKSQSMLARRLSKVAQ